MVERDPDRGGGRDLDGAALRRVVHDLRRVAAARGQGKKDRRRAPGRKKAQFAGALPLPSRFLPQPADLG
jgi:hypothetical protein